MFHPFFNPGSLSDDQVIDKLNSLYVRLAHAESYGQHQMAESIRLMINHLQQEQQERLLKAEKDRVKKEKINYNDPITFGELYSEETNTDNNDKST